MIARIFIVLSIFVMLTCPSLSAAHKLNLFVWAEQGSITVESSLSGGRKLVQGTVQVINTRTGEVVVTGESDHQGIFSFTVPQTLLAESPPLDIIVSGGDGHQAHWTIKAADYGGAAGDDSASTVAGETVELSKPLAAAVDNCLSRAEFESLLDQHLEIKLAPIRKNIGSLVTAPPTFAEIAGGVGYLIGFAGILAWLQSRKNK